MQRRATKNTRGPNAAEKAFQGWVKQQPFCWCGSESGSIVDHCRGSTFKHSKVLIGHWFVLPNCQQCDKKKTIEGKKLGDYAGAWCELMSEYDGENAPDSVWVSIISWGKSWQNG